MESTWKLDFDSSPSQHRHVTRGIKGDILYLCFDEYGYRFSTANDSDGTIAFLCDRARHPRDDSAWISNVPAWCRLKKALGVSKNLNQCRCKGNLL